jgi:hypothetical protein
MQAQRQRPSSSTESHSAAPAVPGPERSPPDPKKYWASFVDGRGKRTRRSTGTANRKDPEALLVK